MTDKKLKMIGYSGQKKKTPFSGKKARQAHIAIILGLILMPGGLLMTGLIQSLIDEEIGNFVKTPTPSDEGYSDFLSDDRPDAIPFYTNFYMHNLTNPNATLHGEMPVFEEIGPYSYRVYSYKYDVSYNDDYSEVTYKSYSNYEFEPELSGDGLDPETDLIENINPGYLGVVDLLGSEKELVRAMVPTVLLQVKEMFIDMVDEMLSDIISLLAGFIGATMPSAEEILYWDWAEDLFPPLYPGAVPGSFPAMIDEFLRLQVKNSLIDPMGIDIDGMQLEITKLNDPDGSPDNASNPDGFLHWPDDLSIAAVADKLMLPQLGYNVLETCRDFWDEENENSLLGMDIFENPIWWTYYDKVPGWTTARDTLLNSFVNNLTIIDSICSWLDASCDPEQNGWIATLCNWQIESWQSDIITTRTVEEWLFTGIDELINNVDPSMAKVGIFLDCSSQWESELNGATTSTINTGQTNINNIAQFVKLDGKSVITQWDPDVNISGTAGTQFAPGVSREQDLEIFIPQFLRPLSVKYKEDVTIKGVDLYRYIFPDDAFVVGEYEDDVAGLANMQVAYGAPVYLGQPHFYGTDKLWEEVGIEAPSQDLHELYIDVEPNAGATMNAKLRMAINIKIEQTDLWSQDIYEAIYPVFWLEQAAEIPDDLAAMFKNLVYMVLDIKAYLHAGLVGGGAALLSIGIVVTTTQRRKSMQKRLEKFEVQKKEFFKYKQELNKYKESKMQVPQTGPKKKKLDQTK